MRHFATFTIAAAMLFWGSGCMAAPPVPVGRSDLAAVYLEFESAYAAAALIDDAAIAEMNRGFDRASLLFFNGQTAPVIRELQSLAARLPKARDDAAARIARALKATSEPATLIAGSVSAWSLRISSMYAVESRDAREAKFTLNLRKSSGEAVHAVDWSGGELAGTFVDSRVELTPLGATISPGVYDIVLDTTDGFARRIGRLQVVARSLDARRIENVAALEKIQSKDAAIQSALATCKARNALLVDQPADTASLPLLVSMEGLADQIESEVAALRESRNPYRRRPGDTWRVITDSSGEYPVRVYAPRDAERNAPLPLLIALHGAGGDENMFFEGYGAGLMKALADEHQFIVAAPLSYPFTLNPGLADRLIEMLEHDYAIDRSRIYLLGHSLGVVGANSILTLRAPRFAGVVAMAGVISLVGVTDAPPMLVISGELDPLSAPDRIRAAVKAAQDDGYNVEWRELKQYGHTLLVGAKLREAMTWLLAKRRTAE
ncbi:MAG: hypothetical protein JNG88_04430 [Phycisphaerales bacterium]|nr:hypothetical protein [Phycisphaerales bacterium]